MQCITLDACVIQVFIISLRVFLESIFFIIANRASFHPGPWTLKNNSLSCAPIVAPACSLSLSPWLPPSAVAVSAAVGQAALPPPPPPPSPPASLHCTVHVYHTHAFVAVAGAAIAPPSVHRRRRRRPGKKKREERGERIIAVAAAEEKGVRKEEDGGVGGRT